MPQNLFKHTHKDTALMKAITAEVQISTPCMGPDFKAREWTRSEIEDCPLFKSLLHLAQCYQDVEIDFVDLKPEDKVNFILAENIWNLVRLFVEVQEKTSKMNIRPRGEVDPLLSEKKSTFMQQLKEKKEQNEGSLVANWLKSAMNMVMTVAERRLDYLNFV